MKKRFMAVLLAAMMMVSVCMINVYAADIEDTEGLTLVPLDDMNAVDISIEEDYNEDDEESKERLSSTDIRDSVFIRQVCVYPIVYCVEEPALYVLEDFYRVKNWTGSSVSFASLPLTADEVNAFIVQVLTALQNNSETSVYTWQIAGWRIETVHNLIANFPLRVEWEPYGRCATWGSEERQTLTVNSQNVNFKVGYNFQLPEDPYSYYYAGMDGTFYCRYTSGPNQGKEYGLPVEGGVRFNSDLT